MGPKLDKLSPIVKIAFDPRQSSIANTIVLQFLTQYFMINRIKRLRKSKKMPKVVMCVIKSHLCPMDCSDQSYSIYDEEVSYL